MSPLLIKVLAGLALLAAVMVGLHLYDVHQQELGAAQFKAEAAEQALVATQENLRESNRRSVAIQGTAHDADVQASAARADADAAHSAGERLRVRLAAAERRRGASDPATPGASAAAGDAPGLVPYDVFEGIRAAAGQLAIFADDLSIRLDACVRSYDALTIRAP